MHLYALPWVHPNGILYTAGRPGFQVSHDFIGPASFRDALRTRIQPSLAQGEWHMQLELRELRKQDYKKTIRFAITGMHFDWYMDSRVLLNLYGRYFWYLELTRATQVIAAYAEGDFAGVLLAAVKGEEKRHRSFWKSLYVTIFDRLQRGFSKDGAGAYEAANKDLFARYCKNNTPDGEILFLAANPELKIKGIGTALLAEFERREQGKTVYVYTDNACTYSFYEHRGFERAGETDIVLRLGSKEVPLKCLLYSKTIP